MGSAQDFPDVMQGGFQVSVDIEGSDTLCVGDVSCRFTVTGDTAVLETTYAEEVNYSMYHQCHIAY